MEIINSYTPETLKIYEAKIDRTEGRNRSSIIVGDFNTSLSIVDRITRQKTVRNRRLKQHNKLLYFIDIHRTIDIHPTIAYTFFSKFSRIHHILGYRLGLNRF